MIPKSDLTLANAVKYLHYMFDRSSFRGCEPLPGVSQLAVAASAQSRGVDRSPAILLHGVMPRCGTVYVGELLRLHPDVFAYPHDLWELPLLQTTPQVLACHREFMQGYRHNAGKLPPNDFLAIFGAGMLGYLHTATPPGKRLLVKVPSVQYLTHFYAMFPHEHLLVLMRDGRDVVQSTLETWPALQFTTVCRRWQLAANMVLAFERQVSDRASGCWLARYEDAVTDPESFVRRACRVYDLDERRYPFEKMGSLPVRGSSENKQRGHVDWDSTPRSDSFHPIGRWLRWSRTRKWLFKRIAGRTLVRTGYETDDDW